MNGFDGRIALCVLFATAARVSVAAPLEKINPIVELEEEVYSIDPANNGAGPMWCFGNTSIVRIGDAVFASGLQTVRGAKPLNNCVPTLYMRSADGWVRVFEGTERTREPCPLAVLPDGRLLLSVNPTRAPRDAYSGPSRPEVLEFQAASVRSLPRVLAPQWDGAPAFSEHSYRSFVVDETNNEMILFQNIDYTHAEWSFRDRNHEWSAFGKLRWPHDDVRGASNPIRVCYPAVALKDRRVFFCGVSDIVEPNAAWRDYKRELTGREWDYDFRRLFFTWSDDITIGKFHDWVEVASRESTAGHVAPNDLYVAPNGDVFVLWTETALDDRLREKFFPDARQRHALECAVLRDGVALRRTTILEGGDGIGGLTPGRGRFHVTADGRLWVFYYVSGTNRDGKSVSENRIVEVDLEGQLGTPATAPLQQPLSTFFTNTIRAGCAPSDLLDVFGQVGSTMRYARIRMR